jgi:hypothetical protein
MDRPPTNIVMSKPEDWIAVEKEFEYQNVLLC